MKTPANPFKRNASGRTIGSTNSISSKFAKLKEKCKQYCKTIFSCGWLTKLFKRKQDTPTLVRRPSNHGVATLKGLPNTLKNTINRPNAPKTAAPYKRNSKDGNRGPGATKNNKNSKNRINRNTSESRLDEYQTEIHYCTLKSNFESTYPKYAHIMHSNDLIKPKETNQGKRQPSLQCIYLHEEHQLNMGNDYNKIFGSSYHNNTRTFGQFYVAPLNRIPAQTEKTRSTFLSLFLCCLGKKQNKGAQKITRNGSNSRSPFGTTAAVAQADIHIISPFNRNTFDFGCQYSLKSNHSLEIISQILTRSDSQLSTSESIYSAKWRRRFRRHKKPPSVLQVMMYTLARKIKDKHRTPIRNKKNNVVVLRVPKKFSNSSTIDTVSTARNSTKFDRFEKPVIIRDDSSHDKININRVVGSRNKIWGPGEVLLKKP